LASRIFRDLKEVKYEGSLMSLSGSLLIGVPFLINHPVETHKIMGGF